MLKKIIIISFNLLFIVSITGLPLTIHLCNMMKKEELSSCPYMKHKEKDMMMHCSKQAENSNTSITQADCCSLLPLTTNVKDKFISLKVEVGHSFSIIAVVAPVNIDNSLKVNISKKYLENGSPPAQIDNHIYLDNYVFLI